MAGHRFIGYIGDLLYAPELDYMQAPDVDIHVGLQSSNLIAQLQAGPGRRRPVRAAGLHRARESRGCGASCPSAVHLDRSLWLVVHADLRPWPASARSPR